MSDDEEEERKLSTRGLPEHEKEAVRREQNRQCVQRFRKNRRDEYRRLCEAHLSNTTKIKVLEERIQALVRVLEDAGITVPPNTTRLVRESLEAAFCDFQDDDDADDEGDNQPDNEQLFDELMEVLDNAEDEGGPS